MYSYVRIGVGSDVSGTNMGLEGINIPKCVNALLERKICKIANGYFTTLFFLNYNLLHFIFVNIKLSYAIVNNIK